jgi:hypothetical protein
VIRKREEKPHAMVSIRKPRVSLRVENGALIEH